MNITLENVLHIVFILWILWHWRLEVKKIKKEEEEGKDP
jgi:hypothetical protein